MVNQPEKDVAACCSLVWVNSSLFQPVAKWPPSFLVLSGPKYRVAQPGLAVATGPGLQ
jgi:hypothetical protein